MEATKKGPVESARISIVADLFWFAVVSVVAGLCVAITVAAMAMLLSQPAQARADIPIVAAAVTVHASRDCP